MICVGKTCRQGRAPCKSPLTCSGAIHEADEAIDRMKLHRIVPAREPEPFTQDGLFNWLDDLADAALTLLWGLLWFVVSGIVVYLAYEGVQKMAVFGAMG